jgi:hypothetical protein
MLFTSAGARPDAQPRPQPHYGVCISVVRAVLDDVDGVVVLSRRCGSCNESAI